MPEGKQIEVLTYSLKEAAAALGISRDLMLKLVRISDFPAVKVGRKWLIGKKKLEEWVDNFSMN